MKPFDDKLPEEREPQHEELITLLKRAYRKPVPLSPTRQTQVLERVRERLMKTDLADSLPEDMPIPEIGELSSSPSKTETRAGKQHPGGRLGRLFNVLAAVLVVAALLGASLILFRHRLPSTGNHPTSATQTYDSFVATNGIMFGFDAQHTHFNPFEHVLNPTTVGGLTKKWTYQPAGTIFSSPAVAGGVVYIGCSCGYLYALDAATGTKKWAYWTGGSQVNDSPAVVGGVVYFGSSEDHTLYALDAATGKMKWAYQTRGAISNSSPAVVGGVVYFGSWDGNVYALDAASGAKKWAYPIGHYVESSPAVAGGVVYVGSDNGNVYALDAASGTKKWIYRTGGVYSSPAVAGGMVYVGSDDGNVYALDAASGTKKWAYQTGIRVEASPAVAGGVVYVGSVDDGTVYALDAATGAKKWTYRTNGQMFSSPTVANGVVYVGSENGNVYALDAATGVKKWAYYPIGMGSSAAVADGVVYFGVYAFHLPGT